MNEVFAVPELLGAILIELPIDDLLFRIPCVNHAWQATVKSSVVIQQKLFFKPRFSKSIIFPDQNPLLLRKFWPWFRGRWWGSFVTVHRIAAIRAMKWTSNQQLRVAYLRRDASWRRMLVCQPAIFKLEVETDVIHHGRVPSTRSSGSVYFVDGVRMGPLYDIVCQWMKSGNACFEVNCMMDDGYTEGEVPPRLILRLEKRLAGDEDESTDLLGADFKSLGFEELDIDFKQKGRDIY